jgi:hypothetical protein
MNMDDKLGLTIRRLGRPKRGFVGLAKYLLGDIKYVTGLKIEKLRLQLLTLINLGEVMQEHEAHNAILQTHLPSFMEQCANGNFESAQRWLNRAQRTAPNDPNVEIMAARMDWAKGDNESALGHAQIAMKKCRGYHRNNLKFVSVAYYWALKRNGDDKTAQRIYNKCSKRYEYWRGWVDTFFSGPTPNISMC